MFAKNIATIYFYTISAAALALIVLGIFASVDFVVNSTQYEKYPLPYFQPADCSSFPPAFVQPTGFGVPFASPSAKEVEESKRQCEENIKQMRMQSRINDLKNAVTFSLIGLILFGIHFPLALKRSNQSKN